MPDAWKHLNLEGQGLQSLNLRLVRQLKKPARAYALLALFPLGLHRSYVGDRRGAWAWRLASLVTLFLLLWRWPWGLCALAALMIALAGDAIGTESRCARRNRELRRRAYFSPGAEAPKDFRGRYSDLDAPDLTSYVLEKDRESPSPHTPAARTAATRAASFNEQEARLKELARRRSNINIKPGQRKFKG